ncbi:hypothetical protein BGZ65_006562 [Modicella reniformis]|uniref:Uncharacterized protein n=1 Tax=Modicella reniformis TaxID=1440133 RepID=A0A9P6MFX5_9FUNG|nr:hypothetical protein BGZ65_006562 [Modicella reniformis]
MAKNWALQCFLTWLYTSTFESIGLMTGIQLILPNIRQEQHWKTLNLTLKRFPSVVPTPVSSVYALRWLKYLKTLSGEPLCTEAESIFAIKKAAVKNQSTFTGLQAKFSTADYAKTPQQTVKRKASEIAHLEPQEPAGGSLAPMIFIPRINDRKKKRQPSATLPSQPSSQSQYGATLTLDNLHCFLAVNYIWDNSFDIGLKTTISEQLSQPKNSRYLPRAEEGSTKDVFPVRKRRWRRYFCAQGASLYVINSVHTIWSNKTATGSRERRKKDGKEGLRPDFQVIKNGIAMLYLEVKPPESTTEQEYLGDRWKLANLVKDELNACYQKHIRLPFMTVIQIYGRKMEVHTISLQYGIYHMSKQFQVYVPCARDDGAAILYSVKVSFRIERRI